MKIAPAVVLALIFLAAVLLEKTLRGLPAKELRRRARVQKDKKANRVYKLAAHGSSAELFLYLVGTLSTAGLILLAFENNRWTGLVLTVIIVQVLWVSQASTVVGGWRFSMAALVAPTFAAVVSFLQPVLGRIAPRSKLHRHSGLYEKEDLIEFLKLQARQVDNRISNDELKIAGGALGFADRTVGAVMTPRRKVKWVAASDSIGPMVMDELHQSGQERFAVVKEVIKAGNPQVVGTLYLKDLLNNLESGGRIRDIMHAGVSYINESQNLLSALDGFLKSGQYLLVVVNNFEEVVGILTIEDVLGQIFGEKIGEDFDRHHDIRAAASYDTTQTNSKAAKPEVE